MNEMPSIYALKAAADVGRCDAYELICKRMKWPLKPTPECPYPNEFLAKAWQDSFDETMAKHARKL